MHIPNSLEALIKEFSRLPGIGPKSASRLAFHVLQMPLESAQRLSDGILLVKKSISTCSICGGISESPVCAVCSDPERDKNIICVAESAKDVLTIEKTGEFKGVYHVLHGVISPLDGIGPEEINIRALLDRCKERKIQEIIIATNPSIEGDATGLYLARLLKPLGIRVTRIAHGLPVGADIEFADSITLAKSISGRVEM